MNEYAEIFLRGEIDPANADQLRTELRARASACDGPLVVDCLDLAFIDAAGLHAIATVHNELRREQRHVTLVNPGPMLARLLDICDLDYLLDAEWRPNRGQDHQLSQLLPESEVNRTAGVS